MKKYDKTTNYTRGRIASLRAILRIRKSFEIRNYSVRIPDYILVC